MGDFEAPTLVGVESSVKYHPYDSRILTLFSITRQKTVPDGQFDWGGSLLKNNEGVQRFP